MKLALIPPIELLEYTDETDCQLMLPQLMENETYRYVYQKHCDDPDQFVILDNGAAEGVTYQVADLVHMAKAFGVDEIVLPDIIGDGQGTRNKANGAFLRQPWLRRDELRIMYVVQGSSFEEFAFELSWAVNHGGIDTVGIPRHAIETCDEAVVRYRLAVLAHGQDPNKPVHLLGGSPLAADELAHYDWPPNVRSTDTSSPFNYAHRNALLRDGEIVKRPTNYFTLGWETFDEDCLKQNVRDLLGWTSDDV